MDKEFSNIRIVDIAKMAGVSVGTVDRVIHNRGRVSEENRKKKFNSNFGCKQWV